MGTSEQILLVCSAEAREGDVEEDVCDVCESEADKRGVGSVPMPSDRSPHPNAPSAEQLLCFLPLLSRPLSHSPQQASNGFGVEEEQEEASSAQRRRETRPSHNNSLDEVVRLSAQLDLRQARLVPLDQSLGECPSHCPLHQPAGAQRTCVGTFVFREHPIPSMR
ncbi:hypothetical protein BLNAU_20770 [Blattamonas nauphoetae]|uniref:Uncharacterized protein n=1 Tax=Blattamonas nauphoetae TaxID=2049346 RepID=A0ABQ9WXY0_9EUKA|nr:hypothetical protein BLNAU_20770 [Blattamonas nauphoetae]